MTKLLLIRHALNDWVGERLPGWTPNVHLNDEGRQQAEALAQRLASLEIEAIYTSPLERAVETAEIIAAAQGLTVQGREGVGEVRFGEWTGQALEDLKKTDLWPAILTYPSGTRFPGGETVTEVQARAVAEIEAIRQAHPEGTVAVVSHGDVIKVVVAHYVGLHLDLFQRLAISPASLTILGFGEMGPRLLSLNDTSHIPPKS
ncbi:MAG: MSMEG_4193 family putative phosphomutase [Anaerolineae bacterium]